MDRSGDRLKQDPIFLESQQMNLQMHTVSKDSSICTGISELLRNGHMVLKNNRRNNELDMTH